MNDHVGVSFNSELKSLMQQKGMADLIRNAREKGVASQPVDESVIAVLAPQYATLSHRLVEIAFNGKRHVLLFGSRENPKAIESVQLVASDQAESPLITRREPARQSAPHPGYFRLQQHQAALVTEMTVNGKKIVLLHIRNAASGVLENAVLPHQLINMGRGATSSAQRDAPRMPTECLTHWMVVLDDRLSRLTAPENAEEAARVARLLREAEEFWLKQDLQIARTRTFLHAAAEQCEQDGLTGLRELARAFVAQLPGSDHEGFAENATRLLDNPYGRAYDDLLVHAAIVTPNEEMLRSVTALGRWLAEFLNIVSARASDSDSASAIGEVAGASRLPHGCLLDGRHWFQGVTQLKKIVAARPDRTTLAVAKYLHGDKTKGLDCIAVPYLVYRALQTMNKKNWGERLKAADAYYDADIVPHRIRKDNWHDAPQELEQIAEELSVLGKLLAARFSGAANHGTSAPDVQRQDHLQDFKFVQLEKIPRDSFFENYLGGPLAAFRGLAAQLVAAPGTDKKLVQKEISALGKAGMGKERMQQLIAEKGRMIRAEAERLRRDAAHAARRTISAGTSLLHQPAAVQGAWMTPSVRPATHLRPDYKRKGEATEQAKARYAQIERNGRFVGDVSGVTNILLHAVAAARDAGREINANEIWKAFAMFMTYDGGHNPEEVYVVAKKLNERLALGIDESTLNGDFSYYSFIPAPGKSGHEYWSARSREAFTGLRDYFRKFSHFYENAGARPGTV